MKQNKKYDLIIVGGGTSGCACAYIAAKRGLSVLVIEKNSELGGTITSGLVVPAMKTESSEINTEFQANFINHLKNIGGQVTYIDGNKGWFNPHLAKIALDKMLSDSGCDICLDSVLYSVKKENNKLIGVNIIHSGLSLYFESEYFVDASGDANLSLLAENQLLELNGDTQPVSLRFIMSGIDLKQFSEWVMRLDKDRNVTTSASIDGDIHLSTAYTWDKNANWALKTVFEEAIKNGDINDYTANYFQIFTIPGMKDSIAFNCPRILSDKRLNFLNPIEYSKLMILGRKNILEISEFCKKYLPGFERSYISDIANSLGVRVSRIAKGKKVFSKDDILSHKPCENIAFTSDYPIDIHSDKKSASKLIDTKGVFEFPLECLISENYSNLFIIGRHASAEFEAQGAIRIQPSCFSMGEAVAKFLTK